MADYIVVTNLDGSQVIRRSDGAFVPLDPGNGDYRTYLARVEAGEVFPTETKTAPAASRHLAPIDFRARFTQPELLAIYTAGNSSGAIAMWIGQLNVARYVDIDDDITGPALQALVDAGLLTADRRAAILT